MKPAAFPRGPKGAAGGRGVVFSEQLSVLMFGGHLEREPEKVVRVLRMLDEMAADEELFLAARLGQRGVHWEWNEKKGLYSLPPYDGRYHASRQLLHWIPEPWQNWGYYAPFGSSQEVANRFKRTEHRAFDDGWRSPRFALHDAIGHAGAVPSADKFLSDLVQMQVTVFSEIITARRPLDDFDVFVRDWSENGGRVLTAEANDLFARKGRILAEIGVPATAAP